MEENNMKGWLDKTEKHLQYIFFGSLLAIYMGLYFICGDAIFVASGSQDWNSSHFNDVRLNFDRWKHDIEGTSGTKNFHLISFSFWLPILGSEISSISIETLMRTHAILLPVLIGILFYKITSLYNEKIGDRVFPCALLVLGGWNIFKAGLAGGIIFGYGFYYANDFYLLFLLALYFFLKKNINYSGLFLFFGILAHPAMGLVASGFFLISLHVIHKDLKYKQSLILMAFISSGLIIQWNIIQTVFPTNLPKIEPEIAWDSIVSNGHINTFRVVQSFFLTSASCLILLGYTSFKSSENETHRKLILLGGAWLILMFLIYNIGFWLEIPIIMKLQPLRFSSAYIFIIFLGIQFPKARIKGVFFILFMAILLGIHSQLNPHPAKELLFSKMLLSILVIAAAGSALYILSFPKWLTSFQSPDIKILRQLTIILMLCIAIAGPVLRWPRAVDERARNIIEASNFASNNLKENATFLLWGEKDLMNGEIFRTLTKSPTIKLHRLGSYLYQSSRVIYDDEIKKTSILFKNQPANLNERIQMVKQAMKKPFTRELAEYYKNNYEVTHIIIFSYPNKLIKSVGKNVFDNTFIQILAL